MAMESIHITMRSSDIDLLERRCSEMNMSKAAYIRYLIAEHENALPNSLKYRELVKEMSDFNTYIKELVLKDDITDMEKIELFEKFNTFIRQTKKYDAVFFIAGGGVLMFISGVVTILTT